MFLLLATSFFRVLGILFHNIVFHCLGVVVQEDIESVNWHAKRFIPLHVVVVLHSSFPQGSLVWDACAVHTVLHSILIHVVILLVDLLRMVLLSALGLSFGGSRRPWHQGMLQSSRALGVALIHSLEAFWFLLHRLHVIFHPHHCGKRGGRQTNLPSVYGGILKMENASGKNAKSCSAFRTMFMNSQQLLTVEK